MSFLFALNLFLLGDFVCPPCGCDQDEVIFEEPGVCEACHMALVPRKPKYVVGIFLFDGIQLLDFTGPMDVLATNSRTFRLHTVAQNLEPVKTSGGLSVLPSHTFETLPEVDVLIIPGGSVGEVVNNEKVITWVQSTGEKADYILSVCTGSFILAKAGLLHGKKATTYHSALGNLEKAYPQVEVTRERWVDNGKIICAAGISSGVDATFHLASKIVGLGRAQKMALDLEYNWQPETSYSRAQFADQAFPNLDWPSSLPFEVSETQGDTDSWEIRGDFFTGLTQEEAHSVFRNLLEQAGVSFTDEKELQWRSQYLGSWWQGQMQLIWKGEKKSLIAKIERE